MGLLTCLTFKPHNSLEKKFKKKICLQSWLQHYRHVNILLWNSMPQMVFHSNFVWIRFNFSNNATFLVSCKQSTPFSLVSMRLFNNAQLGKSEFLLCGGVHQWKIKKTGFFCLWKCLQVNNLKINFFFWSYLPTNNEKKILNR